MGRSPLGLRELKLGTSFLNLRATDSRSPLGLRELKLFSCPLVQPARSRSPLGLRELKLDLLASVISPFPVAARLGCVN